MLLLSMFCHIAFLPLHHSVGPTWFTSHWYHLAPRFGSSSSLSQEILPIFSFLAIGHSALIKPNCLAKDTSSQYTKRLRYNTISTKNHVLPKIFKYIYIFMKYLYFIYVYMKLCHVLLRWYNYTKSKYWIDIAIYIQIFLLLLLL